MASIKTQSRLQVILLTAQFIFGMAINLLGLPREAGSVYSGVSFTLHVLISGGLLFVGLMIATHARNGTNTLGWVGLTAVVLAVVAGILRSTVTGDWWSYLMALGFITAYIVYGRLLLMTSRHETPVKV